MSRIINNAALRFLIDADDVLYITNQTALNVINAEHNTNFTVQDIKKWGKTGTLVDERLKLYASPDFMRNLPIYPGATDFIEKLQQIGEVFITTSVEPQCISARAESLGVNFPTVPHSHYLFVTRKDVVEGDVLLDDGAHNISASKVKYPVLFRRPWNRHLTGAMAVNNYDDFLHFAWQLGERPKPIDLNCGGCICLVGPSCSNKGRIADELCSEEKFVRPLTFTTRPQRSLDNGYKYVSEKEFIELDNRGLFIEKTVYGEAMYGTPIKDIDDIVASGNIAVLPIDICGAISLRNRYGIDKCLLVFCEREKEAILYDLLSEDEIDIATKVNLISSIDREIQNIGLCNISINAEDTPETIKNDILSVFKPVV